MNDSPIYEDLLAKLNVLKKAQLAEGIPTAEVRKERLQRCINLLVENQHDLAEALNQDYGGRSPNLTRMSEVMQTIGHFKDAQKRLVKWMKPERRSAPVPMGLFGAKAQLRYQPKGVIGIMSPWNFPIAMIFNPLCNALAAGNRAMIKPSEFNPKTAALLETLFAKYFASDEVLLVNGGAEVGSAFASLPLGHILFTGAGSIGRKVMEAASKNLTPVTLELGGKSPVIVGESADINEVAARITTGKGNNAGQVCLSPDYVFVPRQKVEAFIDQARQTFREQYPTVIGNPDYNSMINDRHYQRIAAYINEATSSGTRVENLGNDSMQAGDNRIPIHLIIDAPEESAISQEEIFGPVMIIRPYDQLSECTQYINERPSPLGLYYFGKDKGEQQWVLDNTLSGGVTINEVIMHVACTDLPFGGVGASGMGNYHGHEGFKTFSHARGVFTEGKINLAKLAGTLPPYGDKVKKMLDGQIKK